MKFYAVIKPNGQRLKFNDWKEAKKHIKESIYKSFATEAEVDLFLNDPIFLNPKPIYTDGSCLDNISGKYIGWAIYIKDQSTHGTEHQDSGHAINGTNNIAELNAIKMALEYIVSHGVSGKKYRIYTDSNYCLLMCLTCRYNILTGKQLDKNLKNLSLLKQITKLLEKTRHVTQFRKVKAHVGIDGNEIVDKLAKEAAKLSKLSG
jgi:ribonuclease HI